MMRRDGPKLTHRAGAALLITAVIVFTVLLGLFAAQGEGGRFFLREGTPPASPGTPFEAALVNGSVTPGGAITVIALTPTLTVPPNGTREITGEGNDDTLSESGSALATPLPRCSTAPAGWGKYTVQPGDTLSSLAVQTGVTITEIMQANCRTINVLIPGENIFLPLQKPTRLSCGPPGHWVSYKVQAGDTLYSLARRTGTTVYAITQANCLTGTRILAGRSLYLPRLPVVVATPTVIIIVETPPSPPPTLTPTSIPEDDDDDDDDDDGPPPPTNTPVPPTHTPPPPTDTPAPLPSRPAPQPTSTPASDTAKTGSAPTLPQLAGAFGWLGIGLLAGVILLFDNPLWRKKP